MEDHISDAELEFFIDKMYELTGEDVSDIVSGIKFFSEETAKLEEKIERIETENELLRKEQEELIAQLKSEENKD